MYLGYLKLIIMKNLILFFAVMFIGFSAFGQGFSIGFNMGAPVADGHDFYDFTAGFDANYTYSISDKFSGGIATGISSFLGNEIEVGFIDFSLENASFIPLAFAARFDLSDKFMLGADVGYAIGLSHDGGFYYRPILGYNFKTPLQLSLSYRGISVNGLSVSAVTFDIHYTLSRSKDKTTNTK